MSLDRLSETSSDRRTTCAVLASLARGSCLLTLVLQGTVFISVLLGGTLSALAVSYTYTNILVPGAQGTVPEGINNDGQIVGWYTPGSGGLSSFLYNAGSYSNINPPGGPAFAFGINNTGQIAGYYAGGGSLGPSEGFLYSNGGYSNFNVPDVPHQLQTGQPVVAGINDNGQIVGNRAFSGGYLDSGGVFMTIQVPGPCPNCNVTNVFGINNGGQLVGAFSDVNDHTHGFVDKNGTFTPLDFPGFPGFLRGTYAHGINNSGQIVGYAWDQLNDTSHGFVYSDGTFTTIDPPGSYATFATSINANGEIVGYYFTHDPSVQVPLGFLADPTPEPATLLLFGTTMAGLGLAARWRRRRQN